MEEIYKEEYTRETARLDARRDKQPIVHKKSPLAGYGIQAFIFCAIAYTVFSLGRIMGINPKVFLEQDFLIAALVLTYLFLWARLV